MVAALATHASAACFAGASWAIALGTDLGDGPRRQHTLGQWRHGRLALPPVGMQGRRRGCSFVGTGSRRQTRADAASCRWTIGQ